MNVWLGAVSIGAFELGRWRYVDIRVASDDRLAIGVAAGRLLRNRAPFVQPERPACESW